MQIFDANLRNLASINERDIVKNVSWPVMFSKQINFID